MRAARRSPTLTAALAAAAALALQASIVFAEPAAQAPPTPHSAADHGIVADDDLTLVVGTRFVAPSPEGTTAKAQFTDARIPLADFNDTDHCIDQRALEAAQTYFEGLGRVMGKAGHYYFLPEISLKEFAGLCERQYRQPAKAWVDGRTTVIAFGRVVPTTEAAALEKSVR